jgi:hypothetical protein
LDESDAVQQAIQNSLEQHDSFDDVVQQTVPHQEDLDYDAFVMFTAYVAVMQWF